MVKIRKMSQSLLRAQDERIRKMTLADTIDLMNSPDYKERFKAEYYQIRIRTLKLRDMCEAWDAGRLSFAPACSRNLYQNQLSRMGAYCRVLRNRAQMEGIEL